MSVSAVSARPSLLASIKIQLAVIYALTIREGQAHHSTKTLGFFWVIGEPLVLTIGVVVLWSIRGRDAGHLNVSITGMAICAYTHIQLWRRTIFHSLTVFQAYQPIFYHRNVHPLDIILAHTLIESVGIFASFVIITTVAVLFDLIDPPRDPGLLLAAWSLDTLWCFCLSVPCAGIAGQSEIFEKIMHPAMYLTLPITGAFALTDWFPPEHRVILEWVGLANCAEMFHAAFFSLSIHTYWSVKLIVVEALSFLLLGLPILEYARRKMEVPG